MNGQNKWNVGYSSIMFMEQVLTSHTSIASYERKNDIQFLIIRVGELSELNVVFVNEYHLGEAAAYAIIKEFDGVQVIVNNGNWNHILLNWRHFADRTGVIVLKVSDFMKAINVEDLRKHVTEDEREERRRRRQGPS